MSLQFSPTTEAKFQELLTRYPVSRAALVPVLYLAQEEFGWLSNEVMEYVAGRLELPPSQVLNTASFYTLLYKKPVGKFVVQVCRNVSCYIRGSDDITSAVCGHLKIEPGETTSDGLFTVEEVECLGSCGTAPMMQVNLAFHEDLTPESAVDVLEDYRKGAQP